MLKLQWKFVALAFAAASGMAFADHWVGPNEVVRLARQVDNRAQKFCDVGQSHQGLSPFVQEGRRLARDADQFREKVERGAPFQQVIHEYQQLQASYLRMSDTFERAHRITQKWEVRYLWLRLSYAFHELDWAMTQGEGGITITLPDRPDTPEHGPGGHGPRPGPRP